MSDWTRRALLAGICGGATALAGCSEIGSGSFNFDQLPAAGRVEPIVAEFDTTVYDFMLEQNIPGGVLGIAADGEILAERTYGFRDKNLSSEMEQGTVFRIASLSKAFTRAAVFILRERSELALSDKAMSILDLDPLPGDSYTDSLNEIAISHLLSHRAGWDRQEASDPVFTQMDIALEEGWNQPPDERQLVRYMLGKPLQFEPGAGQAYSNLGYIILGLVIEEVSGRPYQEFLEGEVFSTVASAELAVGRSLPADRPAEETAYFDDSLCRNVATMEPLEMVPCPDGGFYLEGATAAGGHTTTTRTMLDFMDAYWLNGRRREADERRSFRYNGSLPGTFSVAVQHNGYDIIVMFNERGYDPSYLSIRQTMFDLLEEQTT